MKNLDEDFTLLLEEKEKIIKAKNQIILYLIVFDILIFGFLFFSFFEVLKFLR